MDDNPFGASNADEEFDDGSTKSNYDDSNPFGDTTTSATATAQDDDNPFGNNSEDEQKNDDNADAADVHNPFGGDDDQVCFY